MAEYIKRKDAEKKLAEILYEEPPYIDSDLAIKRYAKEQLADVPSIDITDLISRQAASDIVYKAYTRDDAVNEIDKLPAVEPKPVMTEEVREAIMRLTMCAREECYMCKYEDSCGYDKQMEMATKNMNTILKAFTEQPKGEWMPIIEANELGDAYQAGIYCSECGETLKCETNFCPNCGADMRGDKE